VFATSSFDTGRMGEYASFHRTLVQTKDLMCVLLTEVLGVVRPADLAVRCRLSVSNPVLKAPMVSALEATI
jgi:hypothetical protein